LSTATKSNEGSNILLSREEQPLVREKSLTARELEVVKLLAQGKTVRAAAVDLGVSSKTVDAHKFNLMRKLRIHKRAELVLWAIRENLVDSSRALQN
jgi:DNA-binding NarL/FixJ family response regulator